MQGEYLKDLSDTNFSALIDELKVPPLNFISLLPSIEPARLLSSSVVTTRIATMERIEVTAVVNRDEAAQRMDEKIAERLQLYSQLEMLSSVSFAAMRQVRLSAQSVCGLVCRRSLWAI